MPLGLYLHFPFCTNKCAYCDFYKEQFAQSSEDQFFQSLMIETRLAKIQMGSDKEFISSIYIGGGTPSLASLTKLREWLDLIHSLFEVEADCEFSFEINPESINREKLETLLEIGVNRPVLGFQSFQPQLLSLLDRKHNPDHSYEALYLVNALGFSNFGVDLIFGLPTQTSKMLSKDIDTVVDLNPPHISLYQLTVEPNTPLAACIKNGEQSELPEELLLAMYQGSVENLRSAGWTRYEVSSFAQEGFECQHNRGYWSGKSYLGLGPGAHSFIDNRRYSVVADINEYNRVLTDGLRPIIEDKSGENERIAEAIMLSLRTTEGILNDQFQNRFSISLEDAIDMAQVEILSKSGHLIMDGEDIRLSDEGFLVADEIIRRLIR